jgi:hypothetical protein
MMDTTMGQSRRTGLTRAKQIESLTLWLGLPLLLLLLSLTAGIVNYTPVRHADATSSARSVPSEAAPAESAPASPTIPIRGDRLVPSEDTGEAAPTLLLDEQAALG